MDAEVFLNQHMSLCSMIHKDQNYLDALSPNLYSVPSPIIRPDPVHVSPNQEAYYVGNLVEMDRVTARIQQEKLLLTRLETQTREAIRILRQSQKMSDPDYASLLLFRYVFHRQWKDIAAHMHISKATVFRWHAKALSLFPLPENPIDIEKELASLEAA